MNRFRLDRLSKSAARTRSEATVYPGIGADKPDATAGEREVSAAPSVRRVDALDVRARYARPLLSLTEAILIRGYAEGDIGGVMVQARIDRVGDADAELIVTTPGSPTWLKAGQGRAPFLQDDLVDLLAQHAAQHLPPAD